MEGALYHTTPLLTSTKESKAVQADARLDANVASPLQQSTYNAGVVTVGTMVLYRQWCSKWDQQAEQRDHQGPRQQVSTTPDEGLVAVTPDYSRIMLDYQQITRKSHLEHQIFSTPKLYACKRTRLRGE